MKRILIGAISSLSIACGGDWHDASLTPERRAELLTAEMTLDEKIGQLRCPYGWEMYEREGDTVRFTDGFLRAVGEEHAGMMWGLFRADPWTRKNLTTGLTPQLAARLANRMQRHAVEHSRLGIPLFFAEEAPHGHMAIGATVFPTALGQASTWNPDLIGRMGAAIAAELRAQGAHIAYGPVLDLARDPRWSRVEECYGEDPFLTAAMGRAFVRGLGSDDLSDPKHALSTLKHFIAYGCSEGGQNGGPVLAGERELREMFLPPFRAAVEAGARSVMTSYNSVDGIPSTANRRMLTDVLRGEWGFEGFVVSDLLSIEGLCETHGVAEDIPDAARQALDAGVDVDLHGEAFAPLGESVAAGRIDEAAIDRAVRRVLALKFEMGLFENPYVDEQAACAVGCGEHLELAREVARQSVILLENRRATLPLDAGALRRVAVVGPNADAVYNQLGDYTAQQTSANTVLDGLVRRLGAGRVEYVRGCGVRDADASEIPAAVAAARRADVVVAVVGGSSARDFDTEFLRTGAAKTGSGAPHDMECGEGNDRATLGLMGVQQRLLEALHATGRPLVVIYVAGRPLDMTWAAEHADALLAAWYPGQRGGDAVADVLLGDVSPAGRLPLSVPRDPGQLPVYYNKRRPAGHDYIDLTARPLYAFGYGLSYSSFRYSALRVEREWAACFRIVCTVENTGGRAAEEVVQLYVRRRTSSTVRPVLALKGFVRRMFDAGERCEVEFRLTAGDLAVVDRRMHETVEPGEVEISVGASSDDIRLRSILNIE